MALAAGITIAWLIEIFKKQNPITYMKTFVKDKRCFAMLGLLVLALLLLWIIFPDQKTQYYAMSSKFEFLVRLFYSFWGIVADATITDFFNISCSDLSATTMNTPAAWSAIGVGFVVFLFV